VALRGLLEAKISLQPFTEEAMKTEPVASEPIGLQQSALSRAARARKSYSMDEDEDDEWAVKGFALWVSQYLASGRLA